MSVTKLKNSVWETAGWSVAVSFLNEWAKLWGEGAGKYHFRKPRPWYPPKQSRWYFSDIKQKKDIWTQPVSASAERNLRFRVLFSKWLWDCPRAMHKFLGKARALCSCFTPAFQGQSRGITSCTVVTSEGSKHRTITEDVRWLRSYFWFKQIKRTCSFSSDISFLVAVTEKKTQGIREFCREAHWKPA